MEDVCGEMVHDSRKPDVKNKNATRSMCAQLLAVGIQNWLTIMLALGVTIPTLVVGALHNHPEEKLNMNNDQASWFGSLSSLTHPIGSLFSGFLQERFGRKGCSLLVNIPFLTGWLTLYFANSIEALYIGIILIGLCSGLTEAPHHSYIGEVGVPQLRGTLSSLTFFTMSVSQLLLFVIGYRFDWRTMVLICSFVPVIAFVCITQIPESPMWLITKNRLKDAERSLCWSRGWVKPEEVHQEFIDLVRHTENSGKGKSPMSQEQGYLKTKFREVIAKKVLLPLRMVFFILIICETTSLLHLMPYLINIFNRFGSPDTKLCLIIYMVVCLMGTIANMILVRRFGKRRLALFSQVLATASILLLGIYCSCFDGPNHFQGHHWIPILLIVINKFLACFGLEMLPWQLLAEVFPPIGRGTACGIAAAFGHIFMSTGMKSFIYLEAWLHFSGVMYLYGAIAVSGTAYLYFYLPETEKKSLEQIESYFTDDHDREEKFSMGRLVRKSSPEYSAPLVDISQQPQTVVNTCMEP